MNYFVPSAICISLYLQEVLQYMEELYNNRAELLESVSPGGGSLPQGLGLLKADSGQLITSKEDVGCVQIKSWENMNTIMLYISS